MDSRLGNLKTDFNAIIDFKENNISALHTLKTRILKIKEIYTDFINANRDHLFVFTLDSFHFQGKLIDIEYQDVMRLFHAITNRMYCDYYKLFKIIIEYVIQNIPDKKLCDLINMHDNFPVYKDLEPFKQYEFHYIQTLHEVIIVILTYLNTYIINKNHDLQIYQSKNKIGLNIDSFVNTFNFNNTVMKEKTELFITYIEFFHKLHTKYLKRFTTKTQLMLSQINNDIKLDTPADVKNANKDMMNDLKDGNIDMKLLRELRVSISDEVSTSDQTKTPDSSRDSLIEEECKEEDDCKEDDCKEDDCKDEDCKDEDCKDEDCKDEEDDNESQEYENVSNKESYKGSETGSSYYEMPVPTNTPGNSIYSSEQYDENTYCDHVSQLTYDCMTDTNIPKYNIQKNELLEPLVDEPFVGEPIVQETFVGEAFEEPILEPIFEAQI